MRIAGLSVGCEQRLDARLATQSCPSRTTAPSGQDGQRLCSRSCPTGRESAFFGKIRYHKPALFATRHELLAPAESELAAELARVSPKQSGGGTTPACRNSYPRSMFYSERQALEGDRDGAKSGPGQDCGRSRRSNAWECTALRCNEVGHVAGGGGPAVRSIV